MRGNRKKIRPGWKPKYPENAVWKLGLVRAIDDDDRLVVALAVVTPADRRFVELDPEAGRPEQVVEIVEQLYEEASWWRRPRRLRVVDEAFAEALADSWPLHTLRIERVAKMPALREAGRDYFTHTERSDEEPAEVSSAGQS